MFGFRSIARAIATYVRQMGEGLGDSVTYSLLFTARQFDSTFTCLRVVTIRKRHYLVVNGGSFASLYDFFGNRFLVTNLERSDSHITFI